MRLAARGVGTQRISDTPLAVLDFETTGLTPGIDRVVEVAVARLEPGREPELVFDTLINPQRRVSATEIHGIAETDVIDAPTFADVAGDLIEALSDCVVTAYNVYFDLGFLSHELKLAGLQHTPPHLCLMYFRPLLSLGYRCSLGRACQAHGIEHDAAHVAGSDVLASARLLVHYLDVLRQREVHTFDDLAHLGKYRFLGSLKNDPFGDSARFQLAPSGRRKSRLLAGERSPVAQKTQPDGIRQYWDALRTVVADLEISDDELLRIKQLREQWALAPEQIRAVHARAFASVVAQFAQDRWLDERERLKLRRFYECLSALGWAPGE